MHRLRPGFTLVELIVAIVILVIGVLGLASTAGVVTRQMTGASQQTVAANIAMSRFEQLRAVNCNALTVPSTGTARSRGVIEVWTVSQGNSVNPSVPTLVLTDTVKFYSGGRIKTRAFRSVRPCP